MAERRPGQSPIYQEATELLKRAQDVYKHGKIGVVEAKWNPAARFKDKPIAILLATDMHYGSIKTDYDLLNKHLDIVQDTPNMFMVSNGDDVDVFTAIGKWATGTYENPLPPQLQTTSMLERLKSLDKEKKIGAMSYGNHNAGITVTGYDWLETFCRGMNAPVFTSGGLLHIKHGKQPYDLAMWHRHWGSSKLNPTNANKRLMEYEYPNADILFLGHTHQSEMLYFERGGKERYAVIGGTYKLAPDDFARQHGIGGRAGTPGYTMLLWPNERRMLGVKGPEIAREVLQGYGVR